MPLVSSELRPPFWYNSCIMSHNILGNRQAIRFKATLVKIGPWTIFRLPQSASAKLPSRGMTMVNGTINGSYFQAPLEPDGRGSHWLKVDTSLCQAADAAVGDTVQLAIQSTNEWPEPEVPADLKKALASAPLAYALWMDITPQARWDWIRWIRSTKQPQTRKRRIEVACSKLTANNRRPCCFNRTQCSEPIVSNNGRLLEPAPGTN